MPKGERLDDWKASLGGGRVMSVLLYCISSKLSWVLRVFGVKKTLCCCLFSLKNFVKSLLA